MTGVPLWSKVGYERVKVNGIQGRALLSKTLLSTPLFPGKDRLHRM